MNKQEKIRKLTDEFVIAVDEEFGELVAMEVNESPNWKKFFFEGFKVCVHDFSTRRPLFIDIYSPASLNLAHLLRVIDLSAQLEQKIMDIEYSE